MLAVCVSLTAASSLSLMLLIFLHSGGLKCFRAASSTCFRLSCQYRLRVSCFMYVLPYIKCKFWGIFAWLCLLHDLVSFYTAEKHRWVSVWNPLICFYRCFWWMFTRIQSVMPIKVSFYMSTKDGRLKLMQNENLSCHYCSADVSLAPSDEPHSCFNAFFLLV